MRRANPPEEPRWGGFDPRSGARARLGDLIAAERGRAQAHIALIRRQEPTASSDRVARVILDRWTKVAAVEGGLTGAAGLFGVPLNLVLFLYCEIAAAVSIAEAYGVRLEGDSGEDAILGVLGEAHGMQDVLRSTPRILGAVAKAVALRHGLASVGRLVPLIAAPIAARLNERDMERLGHEALRRFGKVVFIE